MALKVKKYVLNEKGIVTDEIEGTEAEVEAYLKKNEKKQQSEQKAKEKKLLLDSKKTLDKYTKQDLLDLLAELLVKKASTVEHHYHWYHHGGWYWQPHWDGNRWIYYCTQTNPSTYGFTYQSTGVYACNSIQNLSKTTGMGTSQVYGSLMHEPAVNVQSSGWSAVGSVAALKPTLYTSTSTAANTISSNAINLDSPSVQKNYSFNASMAKSALLSSFSGQDTTVTMKS